MDESGRREHECAGLKDRLRANLGAAGVRDPLYAAAARRSADRLRRPGRRDFGSGSAGLPHVGRLERTFTVALARNADGTRPLMVRLLLRPVRIAARIRRPGLRRPDGGNLVFLL